jgi:hypothetical protein
LDGTDDDPKTHYEFAVTSGLEERTARAEDGAVTSPNVVFASNSEVGIVRIVE